MESVKILESKGEAYPPQPDFVEERTLLSARRVVPLEQVKASTRSHRRLWLISAVLVSLMLGACAAIAMVYLQQRQAQKAANISSPSVLTRTEGGEPVESPSPSIDKEVASNTPDVPAVTSKAKQGRKAALVRGSNASNSETAPLKGGTVSNQSPVVSPAGSEQRPDSETRGQVRREERRPRRVTPNNQRARDNGDDLFRIREIFEGRRRPD